MSTTSDVPKDFDHLDPRTAPRVHDVLALFRRSCPVAHSAAHGGFYVVTKYDHIKHVAQRADLFSSAVDGLGAVVVVPGVDGVLAPLFELDPPEHTFWRRHLQEFFSPVGAARHEPYIRRLTQEAVAGLAPLGRADFVTDLAQRIPPFVVGALLGVPEADRPALSSLTVGLFGAGTVEEAQRIGRDYAEFLLAQIEARRGRDGDDLLTSAVNTEIGGRHATDGELLKLAFLMVAAGHLTTVDTIANTLLVLAQDDALRRRVTADLSLLAEVVEESVRHESAVAATGRTVRADTSLGDVPLSAGDRVLLAWGSANRDEQRFPDGAQFRLDRGRLPVPQLGWGAGAHRCLGMHLARLEVRVVLEEVLRAIPDFSLADGAEPERTYGVIRGVRSLPVEWVTSSS
ncbi:cytochrome P450 [Kibdelosporangium banguiense]|uniref:Cytochrome P450 n=1 Tax=Kibdelosporangium banguiense TaxID=1365924 RepID=A0ABS4TQA5_9PSEU|nr:cytochrome P450 [Kibdelosporangium banguiense]MBP2326595.1 cytochrome P450 [Kibdelosporangium banguiense]